MNYGIQPIPKNLTRENCQILNAKDILKESYPDVILSS